MNPTIIPDFSKINTIKSLASPIFSRSPKDNEIICSVKKLKCQIGPIFPALFSNRPISINLLSFIDSEVTTSFENLDPQFSQILSTKEKLSKNEPLQLFIIPPEITEKDNEIISMTGKLKVDAPGNNPFLLPFDITLALLPLKMRIRCIQYQLSEIKNNYFRLCCMKINSGGIIDFELINYYIHDQFIIAVELESLDENQADQPFKKIEKTKRCISLTLPSVRETTRCQFNVIIKISQNIEFKILCDFLITPFVFAFQMYDYLKHEFTSNSCQIISKTGLKQKLYFRILGNYSLKQMGKVMDLFFPSGIKIIKTDLRKYDKFDFDGFYTFCIEIEIEKAYETSRYSYNYYNYNRIDIEIGNIKKSIQFEFINPSNIPFYPNITDEKAISKNNEFLKIFPCYYYANDENKWRKIKESNDIPKIDENSKVPIIMTTPFNSFSDQNRFTELIYHLSERKYVSAPYTRRFEVEYIKVTLNFVKDEDLLTNGTSADVSSLIRFESKKIFDKKIINSYFSIIGYVKSDTNCWFPAFDEYPYVNHFNKLAYTNEKSNIEKAESNINDMFKTLKSNIKEISAVFSREKPYISQTNSSILLAFLLDKNAILKIPIVISKFPPVLQNEFKDIMQEIDPYISQGESLDEGIRLIISHNVILKFVEVFNERYQDIKSRSFCLQMPIKEEDIQKQIKANLNELMYYDESKAKEKNYDINSIFNEKGSVSNSPDSIPDSVKSNCFIISENDDPKPCDIDGSLGSFSFDESNDEDLTISDSTDALSSLPSINIPSHDSIETYNIFFSECSQATSILPTYIRSIKIKNMDLKESEEYFSKLANVYIEATKSSTSNMSILSNPINRFISSFKNCVKILKIAGANFDKMKLPQSLNGSSGYYQDFIWIPEIEIPIFSHIVWKNKSKVITMAYDDHLAFTPTVFDTLDGDGDDDDDDIRPINPTPSGPNPIPSGPNQPRPINPIVKPNVNPIIFDDDDEDNNENNNNDEEDNNENNNNDVDEEEEEEMDNISNLYHTEQPDGEKVDVKPDDYKPIWNNINEIDILKYVIKLINKLNTNKDKEIELTENLDNSNYTIQNQDELFSTTKKDFPVKELVDYSQYLTMKLIRSLSDSTCPFLTVSCNLLIDCSKTISVENKLYNFMFLISFSYALSSLEIPFTISIIADQNFRFVMKNYDEEISLKILQRVLDCLLIERYRSNIADTFYHSLYLLKHPNRTQRALFIFTDGIDENLVLTESWKKKILYDSNNSFGLIFTESNHPPEINFEIIKKMWNDFNASVKDAHSITRLTYVNPDISPITFDAIAKNFVEVLSCLPNQENPNNQTEKYLKPIFVSNYEEMKEESYLRIKRCIKYNFGVLQSTIFKKTNQIGRVQGTRFEKIDISHFRNKTAKINSSSVKKEIKDDFDHLIRNNILSKMNSNRAQLETIFKPNKASQTVLSSTGTDFEITALILNLINPVPDPLIYLEEKGGLVRNYGVSIVIDSSNSCFNQFSALHSFQTIKVLFSALASIDIPCIDVIIATENSPIVLCSEIQSKRLFSEKSSFWPSLFNSLSGKTSYSCNLESAIHAAYDLRRMRSVDSMSYMFVLTDGLYEDDQKSLIKKHIISCSQNGISIFGIGIGIYPSRISDLFPQVVFSPNPNYLIRAIASFYGDESGESYDSQMKIIMPKKMETETTENIIKDLITKENEPIFKDLKDKLSETFVGMDAFSHVYRKETKSKDSSNQLVNQEGEGSEMYEKDLFKGQKILIVMPYDANMNMEESEKVIKENLSKSSNEKETCVAKAIEYYGIDIKVVQNYKDSINEMTRKTAGGKCDYYAIWVLSGLPYDFPLADDGNQHLVQQFIQCLIKFWENGGSVVLFAEGDPLTFQANLFLQMVEFPGSIKKTKLQLSGNHNGKKTLIADETGLLDKPGTFNKSPNEFKKFQRAPLGHNLYQIYEGETISFVKDDKNIYKPFVPFMRDSQGGISALFYPGDRDQDNKRGDIVIDCGYSKLFDAMTSEGTSKYIQNIAAWTMQYESRYLTIKNPESFRPDAVNFEINENVKYSGFLKAPVDAFTNSASVAPLDPSQLSRRLFAIDYSSSVSGATLYHNELRNIFNSYYRPGDTIMIWDSTYEIINKSRMDSIINQKQGRGGTDPSHIARACSSDSSIPRQHLILVTDGCVDGGSIQRSDEILKQNNIQFQYVTSYIIGNGGDLSVGAPFARCCGSKTVEVRPSYRKEYINASSNDFSAIQMIDRINNISQFNSQYSSLFNATKQRMIGRGCDSQLKGQFERMSQRINQSGNINDDVSRKIRGLIKMASGAIQNVFNIRDIVAIGNGS